MSHQIEQDSPTITGGEKFLAVILSVFILIGTGWIYWQAYDVIIPRPSYTVTPEHQKATDDAIEASDRLSELQYKLTQDQLALDQARADLDIAINSGDDTTQLRKSYIMAQKELELTKERHRVARIASESADAVSAEYDKAEQEAINNAEVSWHHWLLAGLRLALISAMLAGSLFWTQKMRQRNSRYVPMGLAVTISATILSLVFIIDYITDFIDILELGPIVLSALGIAFTLFAFFVLQRHLLKRVNRVRLRKGECVQCSFPIKDSLRYCGKCGILAAEKCESCGELNRLGLDFCSNCGTKKADPVS